MTTRLKFYEKSVGIPFDLICEHGFTCYIETDGGSVGGVK